MGVVTAQKVSAYYEQFKGIEVTFAKEMIQVTGLLTEHVHLKCGSDFFPCVLFATSFHGAKVVANTKSGLLEKVQRANNSVNMRLSFKDTDKGNPVTFFVAGYVDGTAPYKESEDVSLLTIRFAQRPPDYLVEVLGRVLDASVNFKRRNERIALTAESQRRINLASRETVVFIQKVPRRCMLRELSFTSAKLVIMGVAKFLVEKEMSLRIEFDDPKEGFLISGKCVSSENVEGKSEIISLAMEFDPALVPLGYKVRVNNYISTVWADSRIPASGASRESEAVPANAAANASANAGEK
jgi:hypothetical protein